MFKVCEKCNRPMRPYIIKYPYPLPPEIPHGMNGWNCMACNEYHLERKPYGVGEFEKLVTAWDRMVHGDTVLLGMDEIPLKEKLL